MLLEAEGLPESIQRTVVSRPHWMIQRAVNRAKCGDFGPHLSRMMQAHLKEDLAYATTAIAGQQHRLAQVTNALDREG